MTWIATFDDGPAAGETEHIFVVGEPWREIALARLTHGWTIVGGDGIGEQPDAERWATQADYRFDRISWNGHPGESVAHYRYRPHADE